MSSHSFRCPCGFDQIEVWHRWTGLVFLPYFLMGGEEREFCPQCHRWIFPDYRGGFLDEIEDGGGENGKA